MKRSLSLPCILLVFLACLISFVCLCALAGAVYYLYEDSPASLVVYPEINNGEMTATPVVIRPTTQAFPLFPTGTPPGQGMEASPPETLDPRSSLADPLPFVGVTTETLALLEDTLVPLNDLYDLARRLEGKPDIPRSVDPPEFPFQVGDRKRFWVTNVDTHQNFQIEAVLRYVTQSVYFWIEEGVGFDEGDLRELVETFESKIYPTNQAFFGEEWTPGVDGDPRLYILYARNLGRNLAGYFSSADKYHPLVHKYSNAHEMFLLNADNLSLRSRFTYGVLAHEFQHMIHWNQDRNETSWLNEGFSELAAFLNGYYDSGFDLVYIRNPDLQLNDWPNDASATTPHYGASFLFVNYFLGRLGDLATKSLVAHPLNGLYSVDAVLDELKLTDPLNGERITADQVFQDWTIASYLQDDQLADGRYSYALYPNAPSPQATETFSTCPVEKVTRDVRQYGVDYIRFTCPGAFTLRFEGSIQTKALPGNPYSGDYAYWSNKGDESNMTLTRRFDFSAHQGPLTLRYWTWYDLEEHYDYLYLLASTDGERWQILMTPSGTDEDPSGNSYGWAYNGVSGGGSEANWIQESVDLSQFAGEEVYLRFEYVTDAAVYGEGFLLDDIAIPETGYFSDFENDAGGWEASGWARIQNIMPQTFQLAWITQGAGTSVTYLPLAPDLSAEITFRLNDEVTEAVLVVSGATRFTRQPASYTIEVTR